MTNSDVKRSIGRAVVLVGNPAAPYSRALRIGRALTAEGYKVEIAAVSSPGLPNIERDGDIDVRRYAPSGPWARIAASWATARGSLGQRPGATPDTPRRGRSNLGRVLLLPAGALARLSGWLFWPQTVRGWWATLSRDLAPADLYHACGNLTIAAALAARDRAGIRPIGRRAIVIYDVVDDVMESNNVSGMPRPLRAWHARKEHRQARSADVVTTVNDAFAGRMLERWGLRERPLVIPNVPEPPSLEIAASPPNLIRNELGLPLSTRIVVFLGRIGPHVGIDAAAEAVLHVPNAALVLIGFGRGFELSRERDADPRFAGRHFTLAARHPDELLAWTASADATLVPVRPVSLNQRLSTPNKFWELIVVGTPVVVSRDLEVMAALVEEMGLGGVATSAEPADLATSLELVLAATPAEAAARRRRIAAAVAARFSWAVVADAYRTRIRDLARPTDATSGQGWERPQS